MNSNHDIKKHTFRRHNEQNEKRPHFPILLITIIPSTSFFLKLLIG